MQKFLAIFLCFSFLLGSPAEAAIFNGQNTGGTRTKAKAGLITVAPKNVHQKTGSKEGGKKGNTSNKKAVKTKNNNKNLETGRCSPADLELLARLVHAEAQGEPYEGQVAVAATVLNRTEDPYYPDTITEVIYAYDHGYQYCPVRNGAINNPADKQAWDAVGEALAGRDPTDGALSFYNPAQTDNAWIRSRPHLKGIGNHVFVK